MVVIASVNDFKGSDAGIKKKATRFQMRSRISVRPLVFSLGGRLDCNFFPNEMNSG